MPKQIIKKSEEILKKLENSKSKKENKKVLNIKDEMQAKFFSVR